MKRVLVCAWLVALGGPARADVNGRLSLSGMVLKESQDPQPPATPPVAPQSGATPTDASPVTLGYGDLRAMLQGRRLAGGVEFGADLRLRITSDFTRDDTLTGNLPITARGYAGGREYDLRELWVGRRGESVDFALGRMWVREADALRIDGVRLWWRPSAAWTASLFGGLYPNPYARTVTDDYLSTSQLAGAAGASVAYAYPRIWGSASVVGTFFGGNDDGGSVPTTMMPAATPMMLAGNPATESSRVYLTWTNYLRITSWLDLFHDLVVDAAGAAGAQLTRADVLLNLHLKRFTLAAGYDHMSSIAVEMYLLRLLSDRRNYLPGTVENNLIIQRTARDEGHLRADVNPFGRLKIYGDARLRRRALVDPTEDPSFAAADTLTAWDVTVGARSSGDLAGLRLGAAFTEITDYRAETRLFILDAGRDFLGERLSLDANFIWEGIRDFGLDQPLVMTAGGMQTRCPIGMTSMGMTTTALSPGCNGQKSGAVYQAGLTLAIRPSSRWLLLADYRLIYSSPDSANAITTHVAFLRIETRF